MTTTPYPISHSWWIPFRFLSWVIVAPLEGRPADMCVLSPTVAIPSDVRATSIVIIRVVIARPSLTVLSMVAVVREGKGFLAKISSAIICDRNIEGRCRGSSSFLTSRARWWSHGLLFLFPVFNPTFTASIYHSISRLDDSSRFLIWVVCLEIRSILSSIFLTCVTIHPRETHRLSRRPKHPRLSMYHLPIFVPNRWVIL